MKCNFVTEVVTIRWVYENDAELFTLICLKGYFDDNYSHLKTTLELPYLPHARMDCVKEKRDVFTLKYFCNTINNLHFDKVIVRDCHSNVGVALLDRVENEFPKQHIECAIKKSEAEVLFFPDEGAMKRYSSSFDMPYVFGIKTAIGKLVKLRG